MIIDSHNHTDWLGYNLDRFVANMDQYGIDKTWLLSWESPIDEYSPHYYSNTPDLGGEGPVPFRRSLVYADRHPDRFILGYAPDPRKPEAIDRLQMAIDLYGVRIYGEIKLRMMYDNFDAIEMFRFCGTKGLPVVLHLEYPFPLENRYPRSSWWYGGDIETLERVLRACPDTNFIGHAPGFWSHISDDGQVTGYPKGKVNRAGKVAAMLRTYPNLYCDISANSGLNALTRDEEFALTFLLEFHDRILFGRDCFTNLHQEFVNRIGLPREVLDNIFYNNALTLVPLK